MFELLLPYLRSTVGAVLDVGCGDGHLIHYMSRIRPDLTYLGIDPSEEFLKIARESRPDLTYSTNFPAPSNHGNDFALVTVVAVLAHLSEHECHVLLRDIVKCVAHAEHHVVVFELTGPIAERGDGWNRRTLDDYLSMFRSCGLWALSARHISYPAHNFFERRLRPYIERRFTSEMPCSVTIRESQVRISRLLSRLILKLTRNPLARTSSTSNGNTFFVLKVQGR